MKTDQSGVKYWESVIEKLKKSGLSKAEFCRQTGVTGHLLRYWERKLTKTSSDESAVERSPVSFVQLIEQSESSTSIKEIQKYLRIQTSYGCMIEVPL